MLQPGITFLNASNKLPSTKGCWKLFHIRRMFRKKVYLYVEVLGYSARNLVMLLAQRMKFVAALMYTYSERNLLRPLWRDTTTQIPTALLSAHNGNYLRLMFLDNKNETDADVRITSYVYNTIKVHGSDSIMTYLKPGLLAVSLIALAVVFPGCVHFVKWCRRRMTAVREETTIEITPRRTTEPTNDDLSIMQPWKRCTLAACSVHAAKFKKDHRYKMCSICLKEFEEKDKLWILPCEHEFHVACITPWLKERRKQNCPICRRIVIVMPD
ncbi:E3 ubiquitin-protein ligase RNF167-like [Mytilus galloprovincialis]|uniref:E3 ubiquitin-protein ligase RNF167-like n=1 Tax=Mytilus galloprovincialis TaxID=29158 RepID=UPI003F7C36A2